jgi:hypothetical protein
MTGESHRRSEMQSLTFGGAIEAFDKKRMALTSKAPRFPFRHSDAATQGQRVDHEFPSSDIVLVTDAGELCDPQKRAPSEM